MPITDAGKDAEGGPPDGSTDGSSLASLCPGTNAQGTLGPELKGTLVLPLTLDKRLDSVLLNGSSGDLCPLGSTGTGFAQPNTHGYLSSIQANSGFVTLVNATSEEIRASAVFDCPKQYTETGMAFYRGTKAPATKAELVGCVGRVDAKMETECASLETTKSIVIKPCETVTVMVQNTTSVPLPKLGVYWEPTSRQ